MCLNNPQKRGNIVNHTLMCENISKGDDGSYDAICNYYEKYYKQGNQRSTSSLKHHINKYYKKIPWVVRHNKLDALQKMLQAGNTIGA
jgi:hypothetical protein